MNVLLVDDHPLVRDGVRLALQAVLPGANIREAGCAADALALAATTRFRVAVLDVHLPGMNGFELARRLKAQAHAPIVVMLAGEADPWTVAEALSVGASAYVVKTHAGDCLREALHRVLRGGVYLCPDSAAALERADRSSNVSREAPGPSILSEREREVLKHIAHGENTKAIASHLGLSPKTVESHRRNLMHKLSLDSPVALTRYAIRHGLVVA